MLGRLKSHLDLSGERRVLGLGAVLAGECRGVGAAPPGKVLGDAQDARVGQCWP